jgi:uncharacterized protein (TIGR03546 family)
MITRKIGNILRGNATPFQIVTASVLGSLIGFVPGFHQAPGLLLLWIALLVLINANLFLAGVIGVAAKLLALLLTPVSFAAGRVLLEGPTRGVFSALVNGPVSAWFGLEYYVVTGGALLGLVFGLVVGLVLVVLLRRTWRKLAALESDSETFKAWSSKGWVKVSAWIFIGGVKGKQSYEVLLARRFGNPVRLLGLVLVVLSAILGYFAVQFLDSTIVTVALRGALERANGATVDLQQVDVSLRDGRVAITGLALADPDRLDTNLFAAKSIEAKLSTDDLLRRRAVVDSVVVTGGTQGDRRAIPGVRIGLAPEEPAGEWKWPDMQSLDQILANADLWKERLQTAKRWLDKMKSDQPAPGTDGAATPTQPAAPGEPAAPTYEEILRERVRLLGYAEVRDESIVEKAPRLLIRLIAAGEVQAAALPGDPLDIRAENLSTEPHLVPQAPTVRIASKSGRLKTSVAAPAGAAPQLEFLLTGLSVDALVAQIKESSRPALQGGTLDLAANGALGMLDLNLPITLTLHDTALAIGGKPTPLKQLAVPVVVRGTLTNPSIRADGKALQDALVAAGKKELSNRLQAELEKKLSGSGGTSGQGSEDLKKAAGGLLDGLLAPKEKKPATPPTP